jgi:alanyl-tRNA synthetase
MTEKLYLNDTYAFHGTAKVTSIEKLATVFKNSLYKVTLDRTLFHPQGGGQPSDVGTIVVSNDGASAADGPSINVQFVQMGGYGIVEHFGNLVGADDTADTVAQLFAGQDVALAVDAKARLSNAKCHSAGHIIDVAVNCFNARLAAHTPATV